MSESSQLARLDSPSVQLADSAQSDPWTNAATAQALQLHVQEHGNWYEVTADLPGVQRKDIRVAIEPSGTLCLTIDRSVDNRVEQVNGISWTRYEKRHTYIKRSISLPPAADLGGRIVAQLVDGVLQVVVPKRAQQQAPTEVGGPVQHTSQG